MSEPIPQLADGAARAASADYIRAMGQHVASVCVITTTCGAERFGLTATAVSSVCATPPRLLVCVNKSGLTHEKILESGHFCVNVLTEDQDIVAKAFAGMLGKSVDRFAGAAAEAEARLGVMASHPGHESLLYGSRKFRQLRKIFSSLDANAGETLHF